MSYPDENKVVCFGEVLWDILPSGSVPGGAPMNVAYHLHKQEKDPWLITRIGIDERGKALQDIFSGFGVHTDYFQLDGLHETGKVFANPNEFNEVVYDIVKPSAWDFIEWEDRFRELVENSSYFVFGSLASRNEVSGKTLLQLLEGANNKVLDINLRAPHYNRAIVEEFLQRADLLKLNVAELELITGWFSDYNNMDDRVKSIGDKFKIQHIVVTMGEHGAVYYTNESVYRHAGFKVEVADTVGSGDAFLAGLLAKLMEGASPEKALEFASGLGAFVATQKGACPAYTLHELGTFLLQYTTHKFS